MSNINNIISNWLKPIIAFGIKAHRHKHHHIIFAFKHFIKLIHRKTHHLYSSQSYHEIIKSYSFHVHHKDHHQTKHHISSQFHIIHPLKPTPNNSIINITESMRHDYVMHVVPIALSIIRDIGINLIISLA